ncbi:cnl2 nkp2 family protein [Rutstroemia sp. NJR-2017a BBW]|nr:cnl2 nkp2 family protein [Rutstroemia sp. NJR-2017a BBW]
MSPPPTEQHLLSTFLLPPAPLPSIISLSSFTALFPPSAQSSPLVRLLYRHLQHQRNQLLDTVSQAIDDEVQRGNAMRRAVGRVRRADARGDDDIDGEGRVERAQNTSLPVTQPHSLATIIPEMEAAVADLEDEIRVMEEESEELVQGMRGTVGGLSDLRYGRAGDRALGEGVLEGLGRVRGVAGG